MMYRRSNYEVGARFLTYADNRKFRKSFGDVTGINANIERSSRCHLRAAEETQNYRAIIKFEYFIQRLRFLRQYQNLMVCVVVH